MSKKREPEDTYEIVQRSDPTRPCSRPVVIEVGRHGGPKRRMRIKLVWSREDCDERAGFPGMNEMFPKFAGRQWITDAHDERWNWGDAFGYRHGDWLYILACDGDELYRIVDDPDRPASKS
jgi:hypothetical protein